MALSLNFTAPLKQDLESQQCLRQLSAVFAEQVQSMIDAVMAESEIVHFARILVIDNKYIQVHPRAQSQGSGHVRGCHLRPRLSVLGAGRHHCPGAQETVRSGQLRHDDEGRPVRGTGLGPQPIPAPEILSPDFPLRRRRGPAPSSGRWRAA